MAKVSMVVYQSFVWAGDVKKEIKGSSVFKASLLMSMEGKLELQLQLAHNVIFIQMAKTSTHSIVSSFGVWWKLIAAVGKDNEVQNAGNGGDSADGILETVRR